jgi:hypothetical protein
MYFQDCEEFVLAAEVGDVDHHRSLAPGWNFF